MFYVSKVLSMQIFSSNRGSVENSWFNLETKYDIAENGKLTRRGRPLKAKKDLIVMETKTRLNI